MSPSSAGAREGITAGGGVKQEAGNLGASGKQTYKAL